MKDAIAVGGGSDLLIRRVTQVSKKVGLRGWIDGVC